MGRSYVVTGGRRGVGRAIVMRLLADGHAVVVVDLDPDGMVGKPDPDGVVGKPDRRTMVGDDRRQDTQRLLAIVGSAADEDVAERAVELAGTAGEFAGWVNNAATFRDTTLHTAPTRTVLDLIAANFDPVLVGCATAVRHLLAAGTAGAIVNVSSHQAQRAVRGALPYATAKAAVEGLTRAMAVEYGPRGIRTNAVALGSIATERYAAFLADRTPEASAGIEADMARLHPVGRVGQPREVASAVAFLLSDEASFINGAIVPVDGGRSVTGQDPEGT